VRQEVSAYAGEAYGVHGPTKLYYTENLQDLVYCVTAPYDPAYQKGDLVLMARIVDDQVVIDGLVRARPGTRVTPVTGAIAPDPDTADG